MLSAPLSDLEHVQFIHTLRRVTEFFVGRSVVGGATAITDALHFQITSSVTWFLRWSPGIVKKETIVLDDGLP